MLQRGFTLIELLVVLVIVGLFSSMVMLTVTPNDNRNIEREIKRLMVVTQLAQDEAVMQGIELGLTVQSDRYFFSRLQENRWLPLASDGQLSEHILDSSLVMELDVEGEESVQSVDDETQLPAIMILSSGELTGFKLSLYSVEQADNIFQIIGQENGQLTLQSPN